MNPVRQGDLSLLQHPASQELLRSKIPARLAYIWTYGSPRVVPIWFHWNGREIVMASPPKAPKLKALASNPKVAITIDDNTFPHKVLLIRGTAKLENVSGIVPEYEAAAGRWCGLRLRRSGSDCLTSKPAFPAHWPDKGRIKAVALSDHPILRAPAMIDCGLDPDRVPSRLRFSRHGDDTKRIIRISKL